MNELENIVQPGERVDLQTISITRSDEADEERKYYISKVYDITEDRIEILMPMEQTKLILLPVDAEYDLYFYAKKGIYTCKGRVTERYKNESVYVVVLQMITELSKHQRREYYRYGCVLGMVSKQLKMEEENAYLQDKFIEKLPEPQEKSVIVDISGGGLRFVSAQRYDNSRLVICRFVLTVKVESKSFTCVVRVLGSRPVGNGTNNIEYRGQFVFLDNFDRESIIKYIFEEERRLRHRR